MEEINKLKEDIIERYTFWVTDDGTVQDNTGTIKTCLDNFRNLIELLIQKSYEAGQNSH